jgi:hypothetical protein
MAEPVRVQISKQQDGLKEQQARRPDCRRTAKPWQDDAGNNRLHLEQEESANQNGEGV